MSSFGSHFTKRNVPRYFSEHHRDKMRSRRNIDRAMVVPMQDGQWEAALQILLMPFRRPGLTPVHVQGILAAAMPAASSSSSFASASTGSSESSSDRTSASTLVDDRERMNMLAAVREGCTSGVLPQSASLWSQMVRHFVDMGDVREALETAQLGDRCLAKPPLVAASTVPPSSSTSSPAHPHGVTSEQKSLLEKAARNERKKAWLRGGQGVMSMDAATKKVQSAVGMSAAHVAIRAGATTSFAPRHGFSAMTKCALGEMMLPAAARSGDLALTKEIAESFFPEKGATAAHRELIQRWLAEARARNGSWHDALKGHEALSRREDIVAPYVAPAAEPREAFFSGGRSAATFSGASRFQTPSCLPGGISEEGLHSVLQSLDREGHAWRALLLAKRLMPDFPLIEEEGPSNTSTKEGTSRSSGLPWFMVLRRQPASLRAILNALGALQLSGFTPPTATREGVRPWWHLSISIVSQVFGVPPAVEGTFFRKPFELHAPMGGLTAKSASDLEWRCLFFDQVSLDLFFAQIPVPPVGIYDLETIADALSSGKALPSEGGDDSSATKRFAQVEACVRAAETTILFFDTLLVACDELVLSGPVAASVANALLFRDAAVRAVPTLTSSYIQESPSQKDLPNRSHGWARALSLLRNSAINQREKTSTKATAGELAAARIVQFLHHAGPSEACRDAALFQFPHLYPREVVARAAEQRRRGAHSVAHKTPDDLDAPSISGGLSVFHSMRAEEKGGLLPSESTRPGIEYYLRNKVSRNQRLIETADEDFKAATLLQPRLDRRTLDGVDRDTADAYFSYSQDPDTDPRAAPVHGQSEASGYTHYRMGARPISTSSRVPSPLQDWPKVMKNLPNAGRTWRQSTPLGHRESVRKWNPRNPL